MHASGGSRRAWGWHSLADAWAERIVVDAGIRSGDLVLDIGAGYGALTGPLVRAGARVLAIELHPRRADLLRRRFAADTVAVVEADAHDLLLPQRPFRVVSNPPYSLGGTLLRVLTAPGSRLLAAHLVLQHQVVRKAIEQSHSRRRWVYEFGRRLPRSAFTPPPRVDSSVLVISATRPARTRP